MQVRVSVIIGALSRDDDDAFARPRAAVKDAMNATFFPFLSPILDDAE